MFKKNSSILIFFFRAKVDAPLSSADVKFSHNQSRETKFVMAYYKTRNTGTQNNGTQNTSGTAEHPGTVVEQLYIANQSGSAKGHC